MEDPQTLREIDALIESYNWAGAQNREGPIDIAFILKHLVRDPVKHRRFIDDFDTLLPMHKFVLLQVMLKLLESPRLRNKLWCFDILRITFYAYVPFDRQRPGVWQKRSELLFQSATPLFHRLLNHHRAQYRYRAAFFLSQLPNQADQVARWILERLQRERSVVVKRVLIQGIGTLVKSRSLTIETRHKILTYLETLSYTSQPALSLLAAKIALSLLGRRTPSVFINNVLARWPLVGDSKHEYHIARTFISAVKRCYPPPMSAKIVDRLISQAHTQTGLAVIVVSVMDFDGYDPNLRWVTMTPLLRRTVTRALACREM